MSSPLALIMMAAMGTGFYTEKQQEKSERINSWREPRFHSRYAGGMSGMKQIIRELTKPLPRTSAVRNARKRFKQGRGTWSAVLEAARKAEQ